MSRARAVLSFRTRTFAASALIVALALLAVMVTGWGRVFAFEVERLDQRLCAEARRLARRDFPAESVARLAGDVAGKLRVSNLDQLWLRVSSPLEPDTLLWGQLAPGLKEIQALPWHSARTLGNCSV
jgi:two-component system heavy metal sensor histidine kinase CusS